MGFGHGTSMAVSACRCHLHKDTFFSSVFLYIECIESCFYEEHAVHGGPGWTR